MSRIEEMYAKVGFEDQGEVLTILTRYEILKAACHLGLKHCVSRASEEYYKWMLEPIPDFNNPYVFIFSNFFKTHFTLSEFHQI